MSTAPNDTAPNDTAPNDTAPNNTAPNNTAPNDIVDDDLWSAIGDPTRRRMLDLLLARGAGTATTISANLPVTRQAVAKHLAVLDRAGLVRGEPVGREKRYHVDQAQFARAVAQLNSVGASWDARLRRIKTLAEAIQAAADERPTPTTERKPRRDR